MDVDKGKHKRGPKFKPSDQKVVKISFSLPPVYAAWLRSHGNTAFVKAANSKSVPTAR